MLSKTEEGVKRMRRERAVRRWWKGVGEGVSGRDWRGVNGVLKGVEGVSMAWWCR